VIKMRFLFFIFIFLIFSAGLVSGASLSGSPGSLEYELGVGQEKCLIFLVSSQDYSGSLHSVMKWAEKDAEVSSQEDFVLDNSEIDLNVNYAPENIKGLNEEEEIQVCISGDEIGEWKGSLEYRTESSGNIGVGVGTWLKVRITEKSEEEKDSQEQTPPSTTNQNNQNSAGGSGGGIIDNADNSSINETINADNSTTNLTQEALKENSGAPLGELEDEGNEKRSSGITGSIIGNNYIQNNWKKYLAGIFILAIIGFFVYKKKRDNK
jgi:hypothetical protein